MDWFRLRELEARLKRGASEMDAWEAVCRHRKFGLGRYKGARTIPGPYLARTLARFYCRIGVIQRELAVARCHRRANEVAPAAMDSIIGIAGGDFGDAKVRVNEREESVEIDSAAAKVRLAACREILEMVGAVAVKGSGQAQAAVQVNNMNAQATGTAGGDVSLGAALQALRYVDVEAEAAKSARPPADE